MFDRDAIERARRLTAAWEANELRRFVERQPETRARYETLSGLPVNRVYTPAISSSRARPGSAWTSTCRP